MTNSDSRRRYRTRRAVAALGLVFLLLAVLFINRSSFRNLYDQIAGNDFVGSGSGNVTFVLEPGESGAQIAKNLVKAHVVKTFEVTYRLMLARNDKYFPGTYSLKKSMSSSAALDAISNPANLQVTHVTIQEGLKLEQVLSKLAGATGIPISSFSAAVSNIAALGIPSAAPSAEGFLFPATYDFAKNSSATQILKVMVDRCFEELDRYSVTKNDYLRVLTLASIVQKEARQTSDFYKVSRVFTNRLAINMPFQSDATVSYGSGGTTVTTTDAERAAKNGYNTYLRSGLPIGPISAPGSLAIDAALHPVAGKWLFFCAVNLKTGETVFSETVAQHAVAVAKFRAWMAANPGWNG